MRATAPTPASVFAALERRDWAGAKTLVLGHLDAHPRSGEGFLALATACFGLGELDRALLALGQALPLNANAGAGYYLLGLVIDALGQPEFAQRAFATVLRLDPEHPTAMAQRLACRAKRAEQALQPSEAAAIERLLDAVRPTVSACLIVKNEAETLARCLESLKGWVDEIVVVDTGSTDETVAIAEAFGAKVGHFDWVDDFSAARNHSLDLATSEWVLVIDADETLEVGDAEAWMRALRCREFGGGVIRLRNVREDGAIENETPLLRLFQRHPALRFTGRLHETVGPALDALGWPQVDCPFVRLDHTGYQAAAMAARRKGERNLALALQAADEQPDDVHAQLQLARAYVFAGRPEPALPVLARLAAHASLASLPLAAWSNYVSIHVALLLEAGRFAEAATLLDGALAKVPDFPEFLYDRGRARRQLGRLTEARADFERCLAMAGRPFALSMRHGVTDALPRQALAELVRAEAEAGRPTASACLIVKNEAGNLARCLESLKGFVDEIVVVDTGSTDETVSIAEAFGAKVGHFDWCDDFSAARNHSLELATSEWVLVIDADETLEVGDATALAQTLRHPEVGGVAVYQRNVRDDGSVENDAPVLRLFRRLPPIRFQGRLHETVAPAIEALGLAIVDGRFVTLRHTGYQSAAIAEHDKGARNLAIALRVAEERPDDAHAQLELARGYCFANRPAEAQPVLDRLAGLPGLQALPLPAWCNFVTVYFDVLAFAGRFAEAATLLDGALAKVPDFPEFLYDRGRARRQLGRLTEARADFERCLAMAGRPFALSMRHGVTDALPRQALAELDRAEAEAGRPTVSACLIVKNEAGNLARCLESLKGFVDEIVVVDTGSTDETVSIAESFGAKVGHFDWCDDFSAARNHSLALATSEWVLVIDADETLDARPEAWREVLTGPCEGVVLRQTNVDAEGRVESETQALRLFRRDARIRYAGRLHESIAESARAIGWRLGEAPFLRLRHTGYVASRVEATEKGRRNVRLAELTAQERPDSPGAWLDLARSHALDRNPAAALLAYERLLALPGGLAALDDRAWIYAVQGLQAAYQALGRPDDAERTLDEALARLPGFPEFLVERAALRRRRGARALAAADYRACLDARDRAFPVPVRPGLTDAVPTAALAELERPTVSACLIVKNEARRLSACLESLRGRVDEIVVVDTGSTDETVAIAESFGATVGHFTWVNDFSAARNASLALATSEWVLVIDADEQLRVDDEAAWRRALLATDRSYLLEIVNVDPAGVVESRTVSFPRLFRRHPEARFSGRLHESAGQALAALGQPMAPLPGVWLRHEGYSTEAIAQGDKLSRNRDLAERMLRDDPQDPDAWHFLANTAWLAKDAEGTLAALDGLRRVEAAGRPLPLNLKRTAMLVEAWALMAQSRHAEAIAVLDAGLALTPGWVEYLYERGRARAALGDAAGAREDFEACLATPRGAAAAREGLTGYAAHVELVELFLRGDRPDLAAAHLRAAADDPACPPDEAAQLRAVAARLPAAPPAPGPDALGAATEAMDRGDWPAVKAHALTHLGAHPRSGEGFLALAAACYRLGELDRALLALGHGLPLDANVGAGYFLLGLVLAALGQPEFAERAFATALRLDPEHPTALAQRLACRAKRAEHPLQPAQAAPIERLLDAVRPTVSACLIVKNEAETLARCLESLKGWVDEIVVVDTGSTDETVSIAESFGAKVGHFAWCDDFSAARNHSLALATSEWVLVIDADEVLEVDDAEAWVRALRRRAFGGCIVPQRNAQASGEYLDNPLMRLFQRHPDIRYRGRLHEDVTRTIAELGWAISDVPGVRLLHDGYMPERAAAKDKWNRNFQLALAEVEAHPEDVAAWYNLGRSAMYLGQPDGTLAAFTQVERLLAAGAELSEARYCTFVTMHQRLLAEGGRTHEALALLNEGLSRVAGFPEFHYERGLLLATLGRRAEARADFEACLRPSTRDYMAAVREGITDALPRRAIAELDRPTLHA